MTKFPGLHSFGISKDFSTETTELVEDFVVENDFLVTILNFIFEIGAVLNLFVIDDLVNLSILLDGLIRSSILLVGLIFSLIFVDVIDPLVLFEFLIIPSVLLFSFAIDVLTLIFDSVIKTNFMLVDGNIVVIGIEESFLRPEKYVCKLVNLIRIPAK